ncbi:hypothetical protein PC119_g1787 [Phytophthora cactorum]|uniref:Uncharacterized protein n=1 Tax=Phytophthora cactorum TaxID=29920 RepID=A0A8T1DC55_9STRA|nr:hypothetical protein PC114_g17098 [Phytophthora cactorum]KAG2937451.1 hypothetical protein PC117_g11675 [Phytophthora cactorum]KAG3039920.1 hypothetical protein PC119_g1787 [Phytophthora cactorum]KAG3165617.1 hypothetical protein C6341_g12310 [Phytophthora cactorum]
MGTVGVAAPASLQEPVGDLKGAEAQETQALPEAPKKEKANVRLSDFVVGLVQGTTDVQLPTTYKQASTCKQVLAQWRAAILVELQSLKGRKTWKLVPRKVVPRKAAKKAKVITYRGDFTVKRDARGRTQKI